MEEHEIWITRLFNDHLAGSGNGILSLVYARRQPRAALGKTLSPCSCWWSPLLCVLFAFLRSALSVETPGKLQLTFEADLRILRQPDQRLYGAWTARICRLRHFFVFILFSNLIGVVPGFVSPTQVVYVPAGCAMFAVLLLQHHGHPGARRLLHQTISGAKVVARAADGADRNRQPHGAAAVADRASVRQHVCQRKADVIFLSLTYFIGPVVFMGLHVFVALVQAYVFAMLATVYVASAVSHEAHDSGRKFHRW